MCCQSQPKDSTILINCSPYDISLLVLEGIEADITCQNFSIKKLGWRNVSVFLVIEEERHTKEGMAVSLTLITWPINKASVILGKLKKFDHVKGQLK